MRRSRREPSVIRVAAVAFDGINPFHLSLPALVFGTTRAGLSLPRYDYRVCALQRGPLQTTGGFRIEVPWSLDGLEKADIIVIPSWRDPHEPTPGILRDALLAAHERGAKLVALCLGAFVLAETGLLNGRKATTHWYWGRLFRRRFPRVELEVDKLYVDEGSLLTSAGNAAGLDCCLHVFRTHHGARAANQLARRLVTSPVRQGNQAQLIERPIQVDAPGGRLSEVLDWIVSNPRLPHTVSSVAKRSCLSSRTFSRRFQQLTGTSFKRWLIEHRLNVAQALLETNEGTIDEIAVVSGFSDGLSLRQHFASKRGTSPSAYRRAFSGVPNGGLERRRHASRR